MSEEKERDKSTPVEQLGEMIRAFGEAISEIFNDPELKGKAKEFGDSAVESARAFADRLKDEDVKQKFNRFGKAAEDFGKSVQDYFAEKKQK